MSDNLDCQSGNDAKCIFRQSMSQIKDFSVCVYIFTMAFQIKISLKSWKTSQIIDDSDQQQLLL